ncbi:hypothetical protein Tco_0145507 [Tanacetum coccineum]
MSKEVGTPRYLSLVVPQKKVGDEAIHKKLGDIMERDATTASSLEAEQDSGSGPRCQDTILGDVDAQTRFETTSKQSNDPLLSRGYTLESRKDGLKLLELIELFNAARPHLICYALTVNPIIYTSCIQQFWATEKANTVNGERQLQALIDKKKVIITESSVRSDLHLEDAGVTQEETQQDDNVSTPSNDPPLSGEDSMQLSELMILLQQKENGIFISQDKYVAEILKKFNYSDVKSMIGYLMYLTASRPDIRFAVCACARFQVTPKTSHLLAVKRIFRYLKGKSTLGLWYSRDSPFELVAYTDSDYVGATLDRKSTTGGCQFLGNRLISWQCKKKTVVATSTTEVEYVAAASCCGQAKDAQAKEIATLKKRIQRELRPSKDQKFGIALKMHPNREEYCNNMMLMLRLWKYEQSTKTDDSPVGEAVYYCWVMIVCVPKTNEEAKKDQIALDEQIARDIQAKLDAELLEEKKLARKQEEEANIALIESCENTQAIMEADRLLAERLQSKEREELTDEEKAKLFMELMEKRRKHFAALRAQEKRNRPPTKAQKRTQNATY